MALTEDQLKAAAAESAVSLVRDGMIVGLGTGSTAKFAIDEVGKRVKQGMRLVGIPTSERTAAQARSLGIPLATLADHSSIDITIDGADQVENGSLNLVKGLGGALLREKIVANASRQLIIIVHASKLVTQLAAQGLVPVEIVPFGWEVTARHLSRLGASPTLRRNPHGDPFLSDGSNYIVDCAFGPGVAAASLSSEIDHVVGVVEHGLFIGMTSEVHIASVDGVRVVKSPR